MAKYQIRGLSISSNTWKPVYVAEELGVDYEYISIDFTTGEHRSPEHRERHPLCKLPTLTVGSDHIFESNAIAMFLARNEGSSLYPTSALAAARVDQWLNMFTCHLGRAFNNYAFEKVAKEKFGFGTPNPTTIEESHKQILEQLPAVERQLAAHSHIAGSDLSIADLCAFAYAENGQAAGISYSDFPAFQKWYEGIASRDSIKRAHKKLGR